MGRFVLSRREVLRGLIGGAVVTVGLPPLEAMMNGNGTAYAAGGSFPVRFLSFQWGNGTRDMDVWRPLSEGPDWQPSALLQPLVPVKDYCSVLTGYDIKLINKITHHEGMAGMWSGYPFVHLGGLYSKFGGPSIDQVVATEIGSQTFLPSLQVGVSKRVSKDEGYTMWYMSHKGTEQPLAPFYNPIDVYNAMWGNLNPPDPFEKGNRVNVLDAVLEDAHKLQSRLGTADSQRIDAHLESIAQLQQQIKDIPPVCGDPSTPTEDGHDDGFGNERMEAVAQVMSDLLVMAFKCDVTRVASYMLTGGVGHTVYSDLGQGEEQHAMSHAPNANSASLDQTNIWNNERFAYIVQSLKDTPEGSGNVLDNAVLISGTDCSEGWSHSVSDMPVIVAGKGGGKLRYPSVHYRSNGENLTDVLLACVKAAAPNVTSVGGDESLSTTPASSIWIG